MRLSALLGSCAVHLSVLGGVSVAPEAHAPARPRVIEVSWVRPSTRPSSSSATRAPSPPDLPPAKPVVRASSRPDLPPAKPVPPPPVPPSWSNGKSARVGSRATASSPPLQPATTVAAPEPSRALESPRMRTSVMVLEGSVSAAATTANVSPSPLLGGVAGPLARGAPGPSASSMTGAAEGKGSSARGVTRMPELIGDSSMSTPPYPPSAKARGLEGQVLLKVFVSGEGRVTRVRLIRGLDPSCDEVAMRFAEERMRFRPALAGDKPIGVWIDVPITFVIER